MIEPHKTEWWEQIQQSKMSVLHYNIKIKKKIFLVYELFWKQEK